MSKPLLTLLAIGKRIKYIKYEIYVALSVYFYDGLYTYLASDMDTNNLYLPNSKHR